MNENQTVDNTFETNNLFVLTAVLKLCSWALWGLLVDAGRSNTSPHGMGTIPWGGWTLIYDSRQSPRPIPDPAREVELID